MTSDQKTPISKAVEQPQDEDSPEVEGHALKKPGPTVDAPAEAEVEGHAAKRPLMEQPEDNADDEVQGHGFKRL